MIARCANCGLQVVRYGTPDEMNAPCPECGSTWFWCTIFRFSSDLLYRGTYENLVDLESGKLLATTENDE